jgi:hypothetical protein
MCLKGTSVIIVLFLLIVLYEINSSNKKIIFPRYLKVCDFVRSKRHITFSLKESGHVHLSRQLAGWREKPEVPIASRTTSPRHHSQHRWTNFALKW